MATTESVLPSDLYANGYIIDFPDGQSVLLRDKLEIPADENDTYHTYRAGEKLRLIAYEAYKEYDSRAAQLWWAIADVNNIHNPLDMADWVGIDLRIPSYQKVKLKIG